MKTVFTVFLFCIIQSGFVFGQQQREFTLNGKFSSSYYDGLTVYLNQIDYANTNKMTPLDSAVIEGDKFRFSGTLEKTINIRYVTVSENDEMTALVVLEQGTIDLQMSEIPTMNGTVKNNELSEFTEKQIAGRQKLEQLLEEAQSKHSAGLLSEEMEKKMEQEFTAQTNEMQQEVYSFVSGNILNEIGEFFFTIYASSLTPSQLEKLYGASTFWFQEQRIPQGLMNQYVWSLGDLREGLEFKGIEMKNLQGGIEDISVHFKKGNEVLIDFWASWCAPCMRSMPALIKVYDRYKDSGFEIVGISLDERESSWKSAIERLGMSWPQYIDDAGDWRGSAAQKYSITRIPQTYLLDRDGKIAGHDLSGTQLIDKIEELLTEDK